VPTGVPADNVESGPSTTAVPDANAPALLPPINLSNLSLTSALKLGNLLGTQIAQPQESVSVTSVAAVPVPTGGSGNLVLGNVGA
jgi:hypothetical protein